VLPSFLFLAGRSEPSVLKDSLPRLRELTIGEGESALTSLPETLSSIFDSCEALSLAYTGTFSLGARIAAEGDEWVVVDGLKDPAAARREMRKLMVTTNEMDPAVEFVYREDERTGPDGISVDVCEIKVKEAPSGFMGGVGNPPGFQSTTVELAFTDSCAVIAIGPGGSEVTDPALRRLSSGQGGLLEAGAIKLLKARAPEEACFAGYIFPSEVVRKIRIEMMRRFLGAAAAAQTRSMVGPDSRPIIFWASFSGSTMSTTCEVPAESIRRCVESFAEAMGGIAPRKKPTGGGPGGPPAWGEDDEDIVIEFDNF